MKAGRASRTAEVVCFARAFAHGRSSVPRYADETARSLLPAAARVKLDRCRAGPPRRRLARLRYELLVRRSVAMVVRTWEGVIMYLTPDAVRETLEGIALRSAPSSELAALYHEPSWITRLVGLYVRRLGEPFRSAFTPEQMHSLLSRSGWQALRDEDLATLGSRYAEDVVEATRRLTHLRLVIARRG